MRQVLGTIVGFGASVLIVTCAGCGDAATSAQTTTQAPTADTGLLLWSGFQCAVFAERAGKPVEQARLFDLGYEDGRRFVEAVRSKKVNKAELDKVPIGVIGAMSGPTTEFVLGRIYQTAATDAYDRVAKRDASGDPLPAERWILDQKVLEIRAGTEYMVRNCALLK